jgi:uncharacterized phage protein (TIGR01671 family)
MKRFKFRVWCKNKSEWEKDMVLLTTNGGIAQLKNGVHNPCSPETHIVLFYTGLKDKNGKEIYEGDVVSIFYHQKRKGEIYWDNSGLWGTKWNKEGEGFNHRLFAFSNNEFEVMGNIYETPELIGKDHATKSA